MVEGVEYYKDLDRIFSTGKLEDYDVLRAKALAEYLVGIHRTKNHKPGDAELYVQEDQRHGGTRRMCFRSSPTATPLQKIEYLKANELEELEKKCVEYRWKLKRNSYRLSKVHGDFHPWNILFTKDLKKNPARFLLLDRSRGEWGEPADESCALSINYIFSSLRKYGDLRAEYQTLFDEFMNTYLSQSGDQDVLNAMPLFYTFRCLVIASPVWYPTLSPEVRRKIFNFAMNVLDAGRFDPKLVNDYFQDKILIGKANRLGEGS